MKRLVTTCTEILLLQALCASRPAVAGSIAAEVVPAGSPACNPMSDTDIVGYSQCRLFGAWDESGMPHFFFSLPGWGMRFFDTGDLRLAAPGPRTEAAHVGQTGDRAQILAAQGLTLALAIPMPDRFYLGGVFFGSLAGAPPPAVWVEGQRLAPSDETVIAGGGLVGRRFGDGVLQYRAEIVVGGELDSIGADTTDRSGDTVGEPVADHSYLLIEPRAGADLYFLPNWSLDATVGLPLAHPFVPSLSLDLTWHLRSYEQ